MFSNNTHIHFMGICGIGMSGIAKILLQQGYHVSGCDKNIDPQRAVELQQLGCTIDAHQSALCQDPSISMLVRSSDVSLTHPEIISAQKQNIPVHLRAEILAEIMRSKESITIAGAHGKTTTSSLLAHTLLTAKQDPTIVVGGHIHQLNSNAHTGTGEFFVAEADESDRSFLLLPKKYSIVTNIDREHLNTYRDFNDIKQTFVQFMNQLPENGLTIACIDDAGIQAVLPQLTKPYVTYGTTPQADFYIHGIALKSDFSTFELTDTRNNQYLGTWTTSLPGLHNVLNTTSVIALCLHLNIPTQAIQEGISTFQGVDRRFTFKGITKAHGAEIFDDYGHHPREIQVTLDVAQAKTKGKVVIVFQPQRFSRTSSLWDDFVQILAQAPYNELIITDIFAASEQPIEGISSPNLVKAIQNKNPEANVRYIPFTDNGTAIMSQLDLILHPHDLLLFLGAGKVNTIAQKLL